MNCDTDAGAAAVASVADCKLRPDFFTDMTTAGLKYASVAAQTADGYNLNMFRLTLIAAGGKAVAS